MNQKSIVIVGQLAEVVFELKGASNFPVLRAKISTGEKFYEVEASGEQATLNNAIMEKMPIGTRVRAGVTLGGRRTTDGSVFVRMNIVSLSPDFSGVNSATGIITGVVGGSETRPGKNGDFKLPKLILLMADRDGVINDGSVELQFPRDGKDQAMEDWESRVGQYAEVQVSLDAFVSAAGRSYPRYNATKITFNELPDYLHEVMGLDGAPANATLDDVPGVDDLQDVI